MGREIDMRIASAGFMFYAPRGFPVSASRALVLGVELVDSVSLLHGLEEISVEPRWWRRICSYTRYARCIGAHGRDVGLRVAVIVDPPLQQPPPQLRGADLVYEIDSRHGAVIRINKKLNA